MASYIVKIGAGPGVIHDTKIVEANSATKAIRLAQDATKLVWPDGEVVSLELLATDQVVRSKAKP